MEDNTSSSDKVKRVMEECSSIYADDMDMDADEAVGNVGMCVDRSIEDGEEGLELTDEGMDLFEEE